MPVPLVLDCDTGTDDAVAVLCAALHPGIELLGVCTVWGNADVQHTTDNTLRVLELVGAHDVPVVPGLGGPFRGRATPLPSGRDDIPATLDLPPATRGPADAHAPDWLAEVARDTDAPLTLVCTGPLSNLAAALTDDWELAGRLARVVCLAGTHERDGVRPLVERNVWCDPEAAQAVLDSGVADLTFVGMDATAAAPLDDADVTTLRRLDTPAARTAADLATERISVYGGPAPLHDPLAVAHVVDPALVGTRRASAVVDLADGPAYGRTVYDFAGDRLDVGLSADHDRFVRWLSEVLGGPDRR